MISRILLGHSGPLTKCFDLQSSALTLVHDLKFITNIILHEMTNLKRNFRRVIK